MRATPGGLADEQRSSKRTGARAGGTCRGCREVDPGHGRDPRRTCMKRLMTVVLVAGLALVGCGGGQPAGQQRVPVTVLAAASLTDVFPKLKPQFEAANPAADLRFSF